MVHLFHDLPLHDAAPLIIYTYYTSGVLIKYLTFTACLIIFFFVCFVLFCFVTFVDLSMDLVGSPDFYMMAVMQGGRLLFRPLGLGQSLL